MRFYFVVCLVIASSACSGAPGGSNAQNGSNISMNTNVAKHTPGPVSTSSYEIVNTYPHDSKAFTQGLFYHDGFLYESTGQEEHSSLRRVVPETGKVVQKFDLPPETFAEGIVLLNGLIYQLTWREGLCRVFDAKDFSLVREFRYAGDGWGITTDGTNLFMTDGTHVVRVIEPESFKTIRTIAVNREDGKPLYQLNELEFVKGEIWSNVWHSEEPRVLGKPNHIARIDPASGKLLGWIDLDGISPDDVKRDSENTLNGIAYDPVGDRIFVTGKYWKKLFEIKLKPKASVQ